VKPAARPAPSGDAAQRKILRIGVVQAGRIIEERLVRRMESVTIGSSMRNTITILASSLPKSYTLFEVARGRYYLSFTDAIDGRVSIKGRIVSLAQAVKENLAPRAGPVWRLPLSSDSRGKIVLGGVTVLFQFVAPAPPLPRARLPRSIRGGVFQQMDWNLASAFMLVFCLEFGFVTYLRTMDWPRKIAIDQVPDRFAKYIVAEKPKPRRKEETTTGEAEAKAEAKTEEAAPARQRRSRRPQDPEAVARAAAERRARLAERVSRLGALKILGSRGKGGPIADLINRGDPGADADRAFADIGGVGVASAGSGGAGLAGRGGSGAGEAVGIEGLRGVEGPASVDTGARGKEKRVKGIVKSEAPSVDGSIDAGVIARELRRRMGAIRACYERELKRNPRLGGKIVLRFVIGTNGAVREAEIESNTMGDDAVGECIVLNVKRFRFPVPEGGSVEVSYPFVFQPST